MLTIIEYLEDFNFYQQFSSLWAVFQEKFTSFLSPTKKSQLQIQVILNNHKEAQDLYKEILHGRSALRLLSELETLAKDERVTPEKRGQACLVLSNIFQNDIEVKNFHITKDLERSQKYYQQAAKLLGTKVKLSSQSKQTIEKLRAGGESQYALQRLHNIAKLDSSSSSCFAKKALSFIYERGISNPSFIVLPNQTLAQSYRERAVSGFVEIKQAINTFLDTISKFFITPRSNELLQGLAVMDDKRAQFRYAQVLETETKNPEKFLPWFQKAAQRSGDSPLAFESEGYYPAIQYMADAHKDQRYGLKRQEASHYQLQALLSGDNDSIDVLTNLQKQAVKGDSTSNLQMAWHSLENNPVPQAALQEVARFINVAEADRKNWQKYQHRLYEKLCLTVAKIYVSLHLSSGSPETNCKKENLERAIEYYQKIPRSSKHYSEVQFQIAHYQQYILKDESKAINSLEQACSDSSMGGVVRAINLAFNKYCQAHRKDLTAAQKDILRNHKDENFFWGLSHQLPPVNNDKPLSILAKIVNRLELINEQRKSTRKVPLFSLANLRRLMDSFVRDGDKVSLTDLPQSLQATIKAKLPMSLRANFYYALNQHKKNRSNTDFFAKSVVSDNKVSSIFNVMLHLIEKFTEQSKKLPHEAYHEVMAGQYYNFVIQTCGDFIINIQQNQVDTPINVLSNTGSTH